MSERATPGEVQRAGEIRQAYQKLREQVARVIIGQNDVVDELLVAILCRRHALLVGAPGLAKTLLVSTVARALDLTFRRIQFTPDLMPSDITGAEVLEDDPETGRRSRRFLPGPVFAHLVLADEINRTPPKTQAALLEAMQERHVTVGGQTYPLPDPFFVLATQNPIEQEGTYPLPEAQLDRFMFDIRVRYPGADEELEIIRRVTTGGLGEVTPVLTAEETLRMQAGVREVAAGSHVLEFAARIVRSSRPGDPAAPDFVRDWISWGAGPRAGIDLVAAAKTWAVLQGRVHATTRDIERMAPPVLRHRIIPTFHAEASGITREELIRRLVEQARPSEPMTV